jgi:hypothetical protein
VTVSFSPAGTGSVTGSVLLSSNASNGPLSISLTGTGALPHPVVLTWLPSVSAVVGYNVYRSRVSGGPYTLQNSALNVLLTYTDTSIQAGMEYYYVITSVNSQRQESSYSGQVSVVIP